MFNRPHLLLGPLALATLLASTPAAYAADDKKAAAKPALTVTLTQPQSVELPIRIVANGNIAAWQEAIIGAESNGLRLTEVLVNVGDVVKRGQVLATFASETVRADLAESRAAVAEAEARLAEATANAARARDLQAKGFLSPQKVTESLTQETAARARLEAQQAGLRTRNVRVAQTRVLAPDDGIISARNATVGAVLPAGQELFRLIRQSRLEWRAEVPGSDFAALKPGTPALVTPAGGSAIAGKVRALAPTIDAKSRNGIVYVDLPEPGNARAGMFARGEFEIGSSRALTLPQSAVMLRDGFSYVLRVGDDAKVTLTKIGVGRRVGERIEVTGLDANARVVAAGGAFLGDGDTVRVVNAASPAAAK
ncbi:MAG TPA: efflux RND transporter periplasmic adaptor subunit [Rhodocyclaceae bacterium]|nr:efflux RND transporter periplasmic adaptor subunit [Rhodocyclaceae bacterium]